MMNIYYCDWEDFPGANTTTTKIEQIQDEFSELVTKFHGYGAESIPRSNPFLGILSESSRKNKGSILYRKLSTLVSIP